jgi:hypothetical protein
MHWNSRSHESVIDENTWTRHDCKLRPKLNMAGLRISTRGPCPARNSSMMASRFGLGVRPDRWTAPGITRARWSPSSSNVTHTMTCSSG